MKRQQTTHAPRPSAGPSFRSDISALRLYRLEHNLTFEQLSQQMQARSVGVAMRTLYSMCDRPPKGYRPNARTLFRVQKFLRALELEAAAAASDGLAATPPATPPSSHA